MKTSTLLILSAICAIVILVAAGLTLPNLSTGQGTGAPDDLIGHWPLDQDADSMVGGWTGGIHVGRSPDDPYRDMIDQHFWTSLNIVRELAPRMVEAGFGRIAAVTSPMAAAPDAGMSAYGVGKAAQETLFAALAQEVVAMGVFVTAGCPHCAAKCARAVVPAPGWMDAWPRPPCCRRSATS